MAQSGAFPDRASKEAERLVAAIFSSTMREYSAGEHFPHAIMRLRRPTVSHDAQAISSSSSREARQVCGACVWSFPRDGQSRPKRQAAMSPDRYTPEHGVLAGRCEPAILQRE